MISLAEGVSIEEIDGTVIMLSEKGDAAVLNSSASVMVRALLRSSAFEHALERVRGTYAIGESQLRMDMSALVRSLVEFGMLFDGK